MSYPGAKRRVREGMQDEMDGIQEKMAKLNARLQEGLEQASADRAEERRMNAEARERRRALGLSVSDEDSAEERSSGWDSSDAAPPERRVSDYFETVGPAAGDGLGGAGRAWFVVGAGGARAAKAACRGSRMFFCSSLSLDRIKRI